MAVPAFFKELYLTWPVYSDPITVFTPKLPDISCGSIPIYTHFDQYLVKSPHFDQFSPNVDQIPRCFHNIFLVCIEFFDKYRKHPDKYQMSWYFVRYLSVCNSVNKVKLTIKYQVAAFFQLSSNRSRMAFCTNAILTRLLSI